MANIPYTHEELVETGPQRTFAGAQLSEIAFPLGGIGAGTISLGGRGNLRDFEIFNRPAKGNVIPFTFFALWAQAAGKAPVAKILEGRVPPPYRHGFGEPQGQLQGVARFAEATFRGEYPAATVELSDPDVPVKATLRAWNPFVPLNVEDSALPAALFEWTFTNPTSEPVAISLAAAISNPLTAKGADGKPAGAGSLNATQAVGDLRGLLLSHPQADPEDPATGTLALTTSWGDLDVQTHWYRGGWWDKCHLFWDDFSEDGRVASLLDAEPAPGGGDVGSLVLHAVVPAGGSVTLPVAITWLFPRMANPWPGPDPDPKHLVLQTFAGARFADAWAVADHVARNRARLDAETRRWQDAVFSSTLPRDVTEAITSQASILRSCTCFLLADGSFFGWEGCADNNGCCHGNCTHVWNYEQAVAFLFPQLERSMRRTEFIHNTRESGNMAFRTHLPPGERLSEFKPCADGQMGVIIQAYRDWQLSGDDAFLREIWPGLKRALEYAWTMTPEKMDRGAGAGAIGTPGASGRSIDSLWDPDKDGVMEGEQHNTYDIEFFGPNTLGTAMYLGALRAAEEIARHLGEPAKADEYRALYESGRRKVDSELWNGDYYVQQVKVIEGVTVPDALRTPVPTCACKQGSGFGVQGSGEPALDPEQSGCRSSHERAGAVQGSEPAPLNPEPRTLIPKPKYQYGEGCLSDQLLGQWAAHVAGLGYLLDPEHVRRAVHSIFASNFRAPIGGFSNVQRVYALNEEAGLLLCSWPRGNRPALPFVYSDEVWTGIEYQVAAHLIYEGWVDEGLAIVKAIAGRYAGQNRNPWNQVECGHHYARAMASWSVKLALDGFTFSVPEGRLGFAPKLAGDYYQTFWSTGTGWGVYTQGAGTFRLEVLSGTQTLRRLDLAALPAGAVQVTGPAGVVGARREGQSVLLAEAITLAAGQAVTVRGSIS